MDLNVDPNRVIAKLRVQLDESNIARVTLEGAVEQLGDELEATKAELQQLKEQSATGHLPEPTGG